MCAAALHFSERNPSNPQIKKGSVVMATPIYTGLDNGLKSQKWLLCLLKEQSRHIVFLHPVKRQGE